MKILTKIAILLLALLMIVPCLAACGNTGASDTTTADDNGENPGENPENTTKRDPDYIEPIDLGVDGQDYVYNAYVRSKAVPNGSFYCEDFWVAETSEDALSFAVYSRNQTIQSPTRCFQIKRYSPTTTTIEVMTFKQTRRMSLD